MDIKWIYLFTLFLIANARADFFNDPQGVLQYASQPVYYRQKVVQPEPAIDLHSQSYVLPPRVGVAAMALGMGMSVVAKTGRAASRLVARMKPLLGAERFHSVACFPHDQIDGLAQLEGLMQNRIKRWFVLPVVQWWNNISQQQINDIQECHDDGINAAEQIKKWQTAFARWHIQRPMAVAAKLTLGAAKIVDLFLRPLRSVCVRSTNLFDGMQVRGQQMKSFGYQILNQTPSSDEAIWSSNS